MAKTKHAGGRPTKYKKHFCQDIIDWFDVEPFEKIELPHYQVDGKTLKWLDYKLVPRRMPTLRGFAKSIGVDYVNVWRWTKEKEGAYQDEFRNAFVCALEIRKEWLIDLGLSGLTPPLAYKFTAINVTDMVDKTETEVKEHKTITLGDEERKILSNLGAKLVFDGPGND